MKKNNSFRNSLSKMSSWLLRGNNRAKIFFLFISIILWMLIKLSKPGYVNSIRFPVSYENLPSGKVLMNKPPEFIRLQMEASGFTLLKYSLVSYKDLRVNLENVLPLNNGVYYWLPNLDMRDLEVQFNEDATILDISPDTVFFNFESEISRKIPVKHNIKIEPGSGLSLYNKPLLKPDSVLVKGPSNTIDGLEYIETKSYTVSAQSGDSLKATIALKLPELNKVSFSSSKVQAKIQLTRMTEETMEVPIEILNVPDSLAVELFPATTNLTYRVALRDFHRVRPDDFAVTANYAVLQKNSESRFLNLTVEEFPDIIRQVDLDPKRVEYIITTK